MRVAVFSSRRYDRISLDAANHAGKHELVYFEPHLDQRTVALAEGFSGICAFVNDTLNAEVLRELANRGIRTIALRCAGFNNIDLEVADELGITVARVPAYSPYAVAEHTMALILTLNRQTHRAFNRVREGNFALDGLLGFDLYGKTVGVIGTGTIGAVFCRIASGFGCRVLANDLAENQECKDLGVEYVDRDELLKNSDIISLHCPLTPETRHLINPDTIDKMKRGVMVINTSRGALLDTRAAIEGLKSGQIGYLGVDVYEEEGDLFFEDLSGHVLQDDVFARLTTFPNVLVTGHQAFFTSNALAEIAAVTIGNLTSIEETGASPNQLSARYLRKSS